MDLKQDWENNNLISSLYAELPSYGLKNAYKSSNFETLWRVMGTLSQSAKKDEEILIAIDKAFGD